MMSVKASLDITHEICPMTYVRTKLKLESLSDGEILEVFVKGDEPVQSVPTAAREDGHEVISVVKGENEVYRVLLRKRGGHGWRQ